MKIIRHGLVTGLIIQLAIGPVFFFIINITLQRTMIDGLAGALAVTIVDYIYIILAILGIGKLLERQKIKVVFGIISSLVLIIFGGLLMYGAANTATTITDSNSTSVFSSFVAVFLLAISSPLVIFFNTSLLTAKAIEYNYTQKELWLFGFGAGLAPFVFISTAVLFFSLFKGNIHMTFIYIANLIVGLLLIGYGIQRLIRFRYKHLQA